MKLKDVKELQNIFKLNLKCQKENLNQKSRKVQ